MPRHHEAKKSDREDCKDHDCDDLPHDAKPHALKPRPLTRHTGEPERIQHRTKTRLNWRYPSVKATATPVPQSQFGLGFEIHCPAVSGTEKVPMSKIPIFAGFNAAEILMLAASVLVLGAITFVSL